MSEQQLPNKELEAQAAAPAPGAKREEEAKRRVLIAGIKKLIRSFRSLSSHIFEMYREVDDDDDDEGMEIDIEIGFPTDVQHVAHIGLDGSSGNITTSLRRGLQEEARELLSLSTNLTMEHLEHAMASLAAHNKEHSVVVADRSPAAPH
ncbi:hypothetical protein GUJ93_ZPchr0011g28895 [Zizania palustris]|uniref:CRIB domain-containing protein n=1 Tax=Zizania palustris TaxID=103762 RepID=A0A8J6BKJ3_ZIZPA|nr:hypothetical protein GUJ93_ZPchr0011g28895 [Zizania palustris]